ncbi:hypothetical protein LEP1GSC145_2670 [Leptospira interrogans serovar Djasiman str. LT1649]|nr:hypothetical protein LEP1GSC148_2892 [Leptospira interrogans serovar Canicola str. LT1962]EMM91061.1 hypothetical protein LEP1GSC145_2670 [Leptospira interrogans serovar Djasiman str. LT1649]
MIVQFYNLGKSIPSVGIVESRFQFLFLPFENYRFFKSRFVNFDRNLKFLNHGVS